MKVKITIDLDLSGTLYNAKSLEDVPFTLQNIFDAFSETEIHALVGKCNAFTQKDEVVKQELLRIYEDERKIGEQMKKFSIEGVTDDGQSFNYPRLK